MSFGALSANALMALNRGAALGGFSHDTGEGGMSQYHLKYGGDLVWELGSGYFGARAKDGEFDPDLFRDKAAHESVKIVELKLSQGAEPGIGGVLPAAKVTAEIAAARDVPKGVKCVSPPSHTVFSTPRELVLFIALMREMAGGKPTGFKLCLGNRREFLAICKAQQIAAAMGLTGPDQVRPEHLMRRINHTTTSSYGQLYEWLSPGELLHEPTQSWAEDWKAANPDSCPALRTPEEFDDYRRGDHRRGTVRGWRAHHLGCRR